MAERKTKSRKIEWLVKGYGKQGTSKDRDQIVTTLKAQSDRDLPGALETLLQAKVDEILIVRRGQRLVEDRKERAARR